MATPLITEGLDGIEVLAHRDAGQRLGAGQLFAISAMWFALSSLWGALLTLVVPTQVEDILRQQHLTPDEVIAQKGLYLGLVVASGAVVALIIPPAVGAWSDRTTGRLGRRRPFVIGGVGIAIVGMLLMMVPSSMVIYGLGYLIMQCGSNTAGGAFNGIIPDMVPDRQRGSASGWLGMMTILGNITGLLVGSIFLARPHADDLLTGGQQTTLYGILIGILLLFVGITSVFVRERPQTERHPPATLVAIAKSMWISPREYPDFAWVWFTRFLVTMGFNTVQFFLLYFLQDVIHIGRDKLAAYGGYLFLGLLLSAAVTSIVGGQVSDRTGRKPLIYLSGGVMVLAAVAFITLNTVATPGLFPEGTFNTIFWIGIGFGLGYGTYTAVDWALGTDVLPHKDAAAKELGVWHIALVLPQSLATLLSGWLLYAFAGLEAGARYSLVFGTAILYFALGTLLVRNVRKAR